METARQHGIELDAPSVPWSTLGVERAVRDSSSSSEKQKPKQDLNKRNTNRHADMDEGLWLDPNPRQKKKNKTLQATKECQVEKLVFPMDEPTDTIFGVKWSALKSYMYKQPDNMKFTWQVALIYLLQ